MPTSRRTRPASSSARSMVEDEIGEELNTDDDGWSSRLDVSNTVELSKSSRQNIPSQFNDMEARNLPCQSRHTPLISDLHSRGGCQVAQRDCRNHSLWVNLWVRCIDQIVTDQTRKPPMLCPCSVRSSQASHVRATCRESGNVRLFL